MKETINPYGSILPCGGRGKRLLSLTGEETPKSLFQVRGKELIKYSIDIFDPNYIKRLILAVGYQSDKIRAWVEKAELPYMVSFAEQTNPGVLAGLIAGAELVPEESVVACNTDEIRTNVNLKDILTFHQSHGRLATMLTTYSNRLYRHRVIQVREGDSCILATDLKVEEFKNQPDRIGLVNTGFIVFEKKAFEHSDLNYNSDWSGIIDPLCDAGELMAYISPNTAYFNVGTPEEYLEAEAYLEQNS